MPTQLEPRLLQVSVGARSGRAREQACRELRDTRRRSCLAGCWRPGSGAGRPRGNVPPAPMRRRGMLGDAPLTRLWRPGSRSGVAQAPRSPRSWSLRSSGRGGGGSSFARGQGLEVCFLSQLARVRRAGRRSP